MTLTGRPELAVGDGSGLFLRLRDGFVAVSVWVSSLSETRRLRRSIRLRI